MEKYTVGVDIGSYDFDPLNNKVYLKGIPIIGQENLLLITDASVGQILYNFADSSLVGTISNNVITLLTNCAALSPLDNLIIIIELSVVSFPNIEIQPTQDDVFVEASEQFPIAIAPATVGQVDISRAMPVALANQQIFDLQSPIISLYAPPVGSLLAVQDCLQYRSVAFQIDTTAGISAGVLSFEGSNALDNSTSWAALTVFDVTSTTPVGVTSVTLAASTNKYYVAPISFRWFRVRISTAVAGGLVSYLAVYRMTPLSPQFITGYQAMNVAQFGGTTQVTAGVAGTQAIGGNINVGVVPTLYPVTIGGVDNTGKVRRTLTDILGDQIAVGPDLSQYSQTNPIKTSEAISTLDRVNPSELLDLILRELKLQSFYLKELPLLLNLPNAFFKEEITDFSDSIEKLI